MDQSPPSISKFLRAYAWFLLIALILFLAAAYCYHRADETPVQYDQEVSSVVQKLQGATTAEQRQLILNEFNHSREDYISRQHFEHLAEALLLAAIMIVTVEGVTRFIASREVWENNIALTREIQNQNNALTEEIRNKNDTLTLEIQSQADRVLENVWKAISRRLIPKQVADEVEKILKAEVCRVRPEYTVSLSRNSYVDIPQGYLVMRRKLHYRLFNLTTAPVTSVVPIMIFNPFGDCELTTHDGSKVTLPRIRELWVDGKHIAIPEEHRSSFNYTVQLPKMESEKEALDVYSDVEGLGLLTDRALYMQSLPCYDVQLTIDNEANSSIEIVKEGVYISAGATRLRQMPSDTWVCEGGVLPGSALSVMWREIKKDSAPPSST